MCTAKSVLLANCSNEHTALRNMAIFWICFTSSMIFGNLIEFFLLHGQDEFYAEVRIKLFAVLTTSSILGTIALLFIKTMPPESIENGVCEEQKKLTISQGWKKSVGILGQF